MDCLLKFPFRDQLFDFPGRIFPDIQKLHIVKLLIGNPPAAAGCKKISVVVRERSV